MPVRRTFQLVDPYGMLQIRLSMLDLSHAALYQRYPEDRLEIRWCRSEPEARRWLKARASSDSHIYRVVPVESASTSSEAGKQSAKLCRPPGHFGGQDPGSSPPADLAGSRQPDSSPTLPRPGTAGEQSTHSDHSTVSPGLKGWIQGKTD